MAEEPKKKRWTPAVKGSIDNKKGYQVYEPTDSQTPFKVIAIGDKRKIAPLDFDHEKEDLSKLPDLDINNRENNLVALNQFKALVRPTPTEEDKNKYEESHYRFLGENAKDFHDKGWKPIELSNERSVYRSSYPVFNLQRKTGEKAQGFLAIVANPSGKYDVEIRDSKGTPLSAKDDRFVLKDADYPTLSKWMNQRVGYRANSVENNTNNDRLINGSYIPLTTQ
jgi:hypothetical protein